MLCKQGVEQEEEGPSHAFTFFQGVLSLEDTLHSCWAHAWHKVMPQVPTSEGNGQEQFYTCSVFAFGATDSLVGRLPWLCILLRPAQCMGCDPLMLCLFQSYTYVVSKNNILLARRREINTWSVLHLFVGVSKEIWEAKDTDINCADVNFSSYWLPKWRKKKIRCKKTQL